MDQQSFDEIIQAIANGETLVWALDLRGFWPHQFYKRLEMDLANRQQYARAREYQVEGRAEECVTIADTDPDPQRARNRISARQWYAEKMNPKRFGQKIDLTVTDAVNPAALHAEGMRRARLMRDSGNALNGQSIEDAQVIEGAATDKQSVAALPELAGATAPGTPTDIFA